MIVRSSLQTSFGILFRRIGWQIVITGLYATLIYYLYEYHELGFLSSFGFLPVGFIGTVLSVFLAFRNNNAYSRWWEARRHWGGLVNQSRFFAAQLAAILLAGNTVNRPSDSPTQEAFKQELIYRHLMFVEQMQYQLRGQTGLSPRTRNLLPQIDIDLEKTPNIAVRLLQIQSERIGTAAKWGYIGEFQLSPALEVQAHFYTFLGSCERIKNTPFPREYDTFIQLLLWVLILLLPINLLGLFSDNLSKSLIIPISILLIVIVEFANQAGKMMEDPFENKIHDVPMNTIVNTIERDLLSLLPNGTTSIPNRIQPDNGILW